MTTKKKKSWSDLSAKRRAEALIWVERAAEDLAGMGFFGEDKRELRVAGDIHRMLAFVRRSAR